MHRKVFKSLYVKECYVHCAFIIPKETSQALTKANRGKQKEKVSVKGGGACEKQECVPVA